MFNWTRDNKKTRSRRVTLKSVAWLAAAVAMGGSGFSARAQEGQPQPTPNVEAVASVSLSSNKSSVCAGGIGSPVHQATITATVKNSQGSGLSGKSVSFVVENSDENGAPDEVGSVSASNPTSGSPLTVTTGSGGTATVTFTSSRVIGASNIIKASSEGKDGTTSISMADVNGEITIDKEELFADGVDFTYLRLPLTSSGGAVDGHSISWRISKVTYEDENGNIVVVDPSEYSNYGNIEASSTTGTDGTASAKYTTGTSGGTIEFEATDTTVSVKDGGTGGFGGQSAASTNAAGARGTKKFGYKAAKPKPDVAIIIIGNMNSGQPDWIDAAYAANTTAEIQRLGQQFADAGFAAKDILVCYRPSIAGALAVLKPKNVKGFGFFGHGNGGGVFLQDGDMHPRDLWKSRGGTVTVVNGNEVMTGNGRQFKSLYVHACNQPYEDWKRLVINGGTFWTTQPHQQYLGFTGSPLPPW